MTRNDFMKCCAAGVCSCGALAIMAPSGALAEGDSAIDALQWKLDFARRRFARLIEILGQNLDEPSRKKVWEALGRDHAKEDRSLTDKYKGDLPGFLAELKKEWVETAEYDAAAGTIRIVDRATACSCPLVDRKLTPPDFCNCTIGWQKEVYSAVVGKPVEATIEESILRGGTRCVFRIQIQ
jgi:predicted hydrocarbon binding protein